MMHDGSGQGQASWKCLGGVFLSSIFFSIFYLLLRKEEKKKEDPPVCRN